jgi:NADP-dependent aldehyde dehydrogenase
VTVHPLLLDGAWRPAEGPTGAIRAVDPSDGSAIEGRYPVSGAADLERALAAGARAAEELRAASPETLAAFLEDYATELEAYAGAIVAAARRETGLPEEPRLKSVEFPRMTSQLRQAAAAARDRSWCQATIDRKAEIASRRGPLGGPVVIFGPGNFPLAFHALAGGDFAAAVAAGNPVIGKGHPGHPETGRLLAAACLRALERSALPRATAQMFFHCEPELGLALVADPRVGAFAFTGSRRAGLALKEAADRAGRPAFLELSSVNPVFVLPGALVERKESITQEFTASCLLAAGQYCTNPGLVVVPRDAAGAGFLEAVSQRFGAAEPGVLLSAHAPAQIAASIEALVRHGAELVRGGKAAAGPGFRFQNTLLRVSGAKFLEHPDALQTEAFGPVSLFVLAAGADEMVSIARRLEGSLTGTVYSHRDGRDDALRDRIAAELRARVGRLIDDRMPTGVTLSSAMVHGGRFPAAGHPGFTGVGFPASLQRFSALECYDHVRPHRLPPELRGPNPTGRMWRLIDGEWTQRDA